MSVSPTVSVIISAYNRSALLHYAVSSALAQTFRDFELLVIGDGCTDESEAVVRSFVDDRIRWDNLPENCGNQYGPNNRGIELARGRYIAYLGNDDLWHADHLANLVSAIEAREADMVFALTEEIGPPETPTRGLFGLCPRGFYEWSIWAPPSSWLHRRDLVERIGGWRDFRSIVLPVDVDFLDRAFNQGCRIVPVNELTVFKFTSVMRTLSYVSPRSDEQAQWWARLQREPDLRYRELIELLLNLGRVHPEVVARFHLPSRASPGSMVAAYRARRGLPAAASLPAKDRAAPSICPDRSMLRYLNAEIDIGPAADREALHGAGDLPADGLFVGLNWYSLEIDGEGLRWRWIDADAQLVVTRPSGLRRRIVLDLVPGPGIRKLPCRLQMRDSTGAVVSETSVERGGPVAINLPIVQGTGAVFLIGTEDGGGLIQGDQRILNFRLFGFRWAEDRRSTAR